MNIAGVQLRIDSRPHSAERIRQAILGQRQHVVITVNPEMIVQATRDSRFKSIIHRASTHLIDGAGLALMARLKGFGKVDRFTGVDATDHIASVAADSGKRIFLLGTGSKTTLLAAAQSMRSRYPGLVISGLHPGPVLEQTSDGVRYVHSVQEHALLAAIRSAEPDILLVAFGHGKQEKWIDKHKEQLPRIRLFMGVGGTLDFMGGAVKRAPVFMQKWGLEWLYRLTMQPKRWRRIWRATIVFLWKAK